MTLASRSSVVTDRTAWLAERRNGIGASEASAALGMSPFESPRELYLRKIGALPDKEETEAMRWGTLLEPLIAREYERVTRETIFAQQLFLRSPDTPMMATIDAMTESGHPVEFKAIGQWSARELGEDETDQLPDHWLIQAHQQMLLSGTCRCDFAVLVGGQRLRIFQVERDEELTEALIVGVRAFWGCVERREAPEGNARADKRVMHLLYPGCEGETGLGEDVAAILCAQEALRETARKCREEAEAIRVELLERMGNSAVGRLPDGRVLRRKIVNVEAGTIERKAFSYVSLRVGKGGA